MDESTAKAFAGQLRKPEGEEGIKVGKWMNDGNAAMNSDAIRILGPAQNDCILEIGMGNGGFVEDIVSLHPSIRYTGIDYSTVMISEASDINAKWIERGQVDFILATVDNIPFPDNSFNKIFTVNTLYFWEDEQKALAELKRVLKPAGQFIIAIRPQRLTKNYPFTKYGFHLFEKEDVINLLTTAGFSSIETFENIEPDFEKDGEKFKMENLVIRAVKK